MAKKTEPEEIALSVRIPFADNEELETAAALEDRSKASIVRRLIREYVEQRQAVA